MIAGDFEFGGVRDPLLNRQASRKPAHRAVLVGVVKVRLGDLAPQVAPVDDLDAVGRAAEPHRGVRRVVARGRDDVDVLGDGEGAELGDLGVWAARHGWRACRHLEERVCETGKVDGQLAVSNGGPRRREREVDEKVMCSLGDGEVFIRMSIGKADRCLGRRTCESTY